MTGDLILGDGIRLELGAKSGGDAQLFHSGSNAQFINTTGDTYIQNDNIVYITNEATSKNSAAFDTDGAVTLYYDNAAAISTASDGVSLADSKKVKLGGGNDLQLYHDGSDSYITDTGTGNLLIQYSDLYFSKDAGSTHSVVFRSTGNVGIGLTGPDEALHVNGNVMLNNANEIRSKDTGGSTRTIVRVNSSNELEYGWSGAGNVKFMGGSSYTERMRINTNGTVNIGNINFSGNSTDSTISAGNANMKISTLDITGGAGNLDFDIYLAITGGIQRVFQVEAAGSGDTYTNDGSVSSLSDQRIKTDINNLADGLDIVKQLRPVTFKYNDTTEDEEGKHDFGYQSDKIRYGFIAQEVEEVAPHYVETLTRKINNEEVDDFKSLSTTRMIPMLVKAIQELEARIKTLEE